MNNTILQEKKNKYKEEIDKIVRTAYNNEQKALAKYIIDHTNEENIDAIYTFITQRVKLGFVFDSAPEVNHNCVALCEKNEKLSFYGNDFNQLGNLFEREREREYNNHKLIIGENYDALKNLIATYTENGEGLIDFIYIDPPYNTESTRADGNDYKSDDVKANKFMYRDKFTRTGWLNMMRERLVLARKLLSDQGVIFISIDDTEQAYLKILCDEVFGEENFIENLIWLNKEGGGKSDSKFFRTKHEYILCCAKNYKRMHINSIEVEDIDRYTLQDEYVETRGKYQLVKLDSGSLGWIKSLDYPIEYKGHTFYAGGNKEKWQDRQNGGTNIKDYGWRWRWSKDKLKWGIDNNFIEIKQNKNNEWNIYTKQYLYCDSNGNISVRKNQPLSYLEISSTIQANREIKDLFAKVPFNYSKPTALIKHLLKIASKTDSICLDFFAGSGTTGQAVMELNEEDGGNRQCILVTNNENNIGTDICRERLYRVVNGKGSNSEEIKWTYSKDKKCLSNNCWDVFEIKNYELKIDDYEKAKELIEKAKKEFKSLNVNYEAKDFDIYNQLSNLKPFIKDEN